MYHVTEAVHAVVGSIVVVSALTRRALLHSMCDLKAAQMNVQGTRTRNLMLYKFEMSYNAAEATKNICCVEGEDFADSSTITR